MCSRLHSQCHEWSESTNAPASLIDGGEGAVKDALSRGGETVAPVPIKITKCEDKYITPSPTMVSKAQNNNVFGSFDSTMSVISHLFQFPILIHYITPSFVS